MASFPDTPSAHVPPLMAIVCGFGALRVNAIDPLVARNFTFASPLQALRGITQYNWYMVLDADSLARTEATTQWGIDTTFETLADAAHTTPDVAIFSAMYPHILDVLKALPSLKGILLNIPVTLNSARLTEILDYCDAAHIAVQMNIWRRGVPLYQELSHRDILKDIGSVLSASALHQGAPVTDLSSGQAGGCGLLPMLDFIQWLFGAAEKVTTLKGCADGHAHNIPFVLHIPDHIHVHVHPLSTASYCENAFDFWGTKSRISITQNGLLRTIYPCVPSRSFSKQHELAADRPIQSKVPVGNAIYHLYHNLASHIQEGAPLLAPGRAYLQTLHTYESLCHAAKQHFESGVSTPVSLPVPYAPP